MANLSSNFIYQYAIENEVLTLDGYSPLFNGVTRERVRQKLKELGIDRRIIHKMIAANREKREYSQIRGDYKVIPNLKYKYLVTSTGQIFKVKQLYVKNNITYEALISAIGKPNKTNKNGKVEYKRLSCLDADGIARYRYVHKLVAEAFLPNPDNLPCINHIDGDGTNNHVNNLEWCTYKDNTKHSIEVLGRHGALILSGGRGRKHKHDRATRKTIANLHTKQGVPCKVLAAEYAVTTPTVRKYINEVYPNFVFTYKH